MKTAKKTISIVMAVIMLFTGSPILQANDLSLNLDRAQIAELQKEIKDDLFMNENVHKTNMQYDAIKDIKARHEQAKKNFAIRLEELDEITKDKDVDEAEKYKDQLEKKAEELVKKDKERYANIPRNERKIVSLSTAIFDEIREWEKETFDTEDPIKILGYEIVCAIIMQMVVGGLIWGLGALFGSLAEDAAILTASKVGKIMAIAGYGELIIWIIVAIIIECLFTGAYTPVMSHSMNAEDTMKAFSERPFMLLGKFENEVEYVNLYNKCPDLLKDVVDIEYYTSLELNYEYTKDKCYVQTIYWRDLSVEDRVTYLHNFAERLRAKAREGVKEKSNSLKIGLQEA